MKLSLIVFLALTLTACASFDKAVTNTDFKNTDINGTYNVFSENEAKGPAYYFANANENFYHKYGRGQWDTIKFDTLTGGTFAIKILDNKALRVGFYKGDKLVREQYLKYKLKDGWIYVRNKNFLFGGIPYVIGGIDQKRVRMTLNNRGNLIIESAVYSEGALLVFLADEKKWNHKNEYKRIR